MGLDCSHDAFSGAYSSFSRFRKVIVTLMDGSFPPHEDKSLDPNSWYWSNQYSQETHPGLFVFLCHSDCDGEISPEDCKKIADEMEALLPKIDEMGEGEGHIKRDGGYGEVARRFIKGCRKAHKANEPLEFY